MLVEDVDILFDDPTVGWHYCLSEDEENHLCTYMKLFICENFKSHKEINNFITDNGMWGCFPSIRSLNDHGLKKKIPGILPKFYKIVCEILDVESGNGTKLDNATPY